VRSWLPLPFGRRNSKPSSELERERAVRHEIENALLWEISVSSALSTLYKPLISADSSIQEMARTVLEQARRITGSAHGFVAALDPVSGQNLVHTVTAMHSVKLPAAVPGRLRLEREPGGDFSGLRGQSLNTGKAFFTNDPTRHPAFTGYPGWHRPVTRFLSAPVMLAGRPAGQIALANAPRDYTGRDLKAVKRLAGFYALALQRREAQQQMQDALREKEVLLREIHHRVKNNLQVISSLLNLQAGAIRDAAALEMLKESQNRVRSMALVHEQLHRSRDLSRICFSDYARNLTASLFCSYGIDSSAIALELRIADAFLPIDVAVPCGLIIQELVSNSLKHAFPAGRRGSITISLQPDGSHPEQDSECAAARWSLTISDDGVGLPPGVDPETSNSLGLRLVRILTDQLSGGVHRTEGSGTGFRIEFEIERRESHTT